jgi:plasmid stability protein
VEFSIMTNLTISLDESVVRSARIRAIAEGTSVSAKVREFLAQYASNRDGQHQAGEAFLAMARASKQSSPEGWKFNRDEIYEERMRWPREDPAT